MKKMKAFDASDVRTMNRRTVFELLLKEGELSKAEISRKSGISAPTVQKIVEFFLDRGIFSEVGVGESALGRKPLLLRVEPGSIYTIGVEFEGKSLHLGLVDLQGRIKATRQSGVFHDFRTLVDGGLSREVEALIADSGLDRERLAGIGIGLPGVVDPETSRVKFAPLIGIEEELDCDGFRRTLEAEFGAMVRFENDVNAAAVGEFVYRKLPSTGDLLYLSLGTGFGAGVIIDGKLRRGALSSAGEIGYMVFDPTYHSRKAATGWLEARVSLDSIEKGLTSLDGASADIGVCVANIAALLDVRLVVLGGAARRIYGEQLLHLISGYLETLCFDPLEFLLSENPEPGIVGSAALVFSRGFDRILRT